MCAWQAAQDIPHPRANLLKKGVAVDNVCLFCSSSPDSVLHVFNGCPFAKATLFASNIEHGRSNAACSSVFEWLCHQANVLPPGKFDLMLCVIALHLVSPKCIVMGEH